MMLHTEKIPIRGQYDLLVAGGGVAGVAAALSAARMGKKVLLLEKSQKLGGLATLGLINFFVPMCNGRGRQILFGMAEEFLRESIRYGYDTLPADFGQPGSGARYCTKYSPELFALRLTEMLVEAGVALMFDTIACEPVMEGAHCRGLIVENKSGRSFYAGGMVLDATGDGDLLFRAGVPTVACGNYHTYLGFGITLESCRNAAERGNIRHAITSCSGGNATLYGDRQPDGLPLYGGTSSDSVNDYLIRNQLELLQKYKHDDRLSRDIVTLPGMCQFRTTRCIVGNATLRESDAFRHFDDSIGAISDFDRRDYLYEVPYGCLVRSGYDNLLTAGRSASGEGYGWDVLRVIPPAILTGQAAGIAACLAIDSCRAVAEIDIMNLQQQLAQTGVLIHFDDAWVPEKLEGKRENIEDGQL